MRLILAAALLFCAGCASMPDLKDGGLPLAKSGWRMTGGADFDKKAWFVMFWRPWGKAESDAVASADKIVLP
jgi:hypothetical protein